MGGVSDLRENKVVGVVGKPKVDKPVEGILPHPTGEEKRNLSDVWASEREPVRRGFISFAFWVFVRGWATERV